MPLPLSKEYRYQYKFVVDDEWMCDPQRPQVEDGQGHLNHELVVVLMEQNPALDTTHELLNRSRSSSLVESSAYSKSLPIPVVEVSEHQEEEKEKGEKKTAEVVVDEETKKNPDQGLDGEVSTATSAAVAAAPATAARRPVKAMETYEAVMVFEERDDLSDGEGRSKNQALSEDEEDDQDEIVSEAPGKQKFNGKRLFSLLFFGRMVSTTTHAHTHIPHMNALLFLYCPWLWGEGG